MNQAWIRYLPTFIAKQVDGRHNLQRILANTGWLFADKIVRMGVGLFVVGWVARYLGPAQFGVLNYAVAFVALFNPIATVGFDSIVVRDIVRTPREAGVILGSALGCSLGAGLMTAIFVTGLIYFMKHGDTVTVWMVAILSMTMIFNSFDVIDYWFQSQVKSRYTVIARNSAFLVASLLTVYLIASKASVMSFALIRTVEIALGAVGLTILYRLSGKRLRAWKFIGSRAKELVSDSWPLILSGMVIMIYMRIDQIMIGEMIGSEAVGQFSAAVRISEVWYFIPAGIVSSAFPAIVEAKNISGALYKRRMQKLCNALSLISYAIAIPMSFFSGDVIAFIFGSQYTGAASVLSVHIWAAIFVFLGIAKRAWINTEGLMKYTFMSTSIGAVLNILLNLFFIRQWGMLGAAYATLISQFVASVGANVLFKETQPIFFMQMNSLLLLGWGKKASRA